MTRQLPGLYWDSDKQRYFPLAHRQSEQRQPAPAPTPTLVNRHRIRPVVDLRSVLRTAHKDTLVHQVQSTQIASGGHQLAWSAIGGPAVSAFRSLSHNGSLLNFAGDSLGWFYSSQAVSCDEHDIAWFPQYYLSSEISSICVSDTACVATSFGPECRILYAPLDLSVVVMQKIDNRTVHDVWTADLHDSRLVLGANQQAVMIEDISVPTSLQRLPTHSDVLALAQRDYMLYTGLRNGGITCFDTRLPRSNSFPLFDSASQGPGSVTGLKDLRDNQLVVSFINGEISTFDLRVPTRTPFMTFTGNFNQYYVKLPLAVDPYEKFLFAAGQNNRTHVWSLLTGGPPLDPGGTSSTSQTVFQNLFEHRITALQVVEEMEGMCLWVASGSELFKYSLGYHPTMCI